MASNQIKEISRKVLSDAIFRYFYKGKFPNTKQIPLDLLWEKERRIYSTLHGLVTSLGTTLWQELAKKIAEEVGAFTILDPKILEQPVDKEKANRLIHFWEEQRNKRGSNIELTDFINELKQAFPNPALPSEKYEKLTKSLGVDLLLLKNGNEWGIESKTVQLNSGGGPEFNEKLMKWYAYRYSQRGSGHNFQAFVAIPYNPYHQSWFVEEQGRIHPLTTNDVKVQEEYWDFLSSKTKAWESIVEGFKQVAADKKLMLLYQEALSKPPNNFIALVLSQQIECELITEILNAKPRSQSLRWRCYACKSEFDGSLNQIRPAILTAERKIIKCPSCLRPFNLS